MTKPRAVWRKQEAARGGVIWKGSGETHGSQEEDAEGKGECGEAGGQADGLRGDMFVSAHVLGHDVSGSGGAGTGKDIDAGEFNAAEAEENGDGNDDAGDDDESDQNGGQRVTKIVLEVVRAEIRTEGKQGEGVCGSADVADGIFHGVGEAPAHAAEEQTDRAAEDERVFQKFQCRLQDGVALFIVFGDEHHEIDRGKDIVEGNDKGKNDGAGGVSTLTVHVGEEGSALNEEVGAEHALDHTGGDGTVLYETRNDKQGQHETEGDGAQILICRGVS